MKKLVLLIAVIMSAVLFKKAHAQVGVNVNINLGAPPVYVAPPTAQVSYYYMPDIGAYYYVPARRYYYHSNGRWISAAYLPGAYRSCNVYSVRHVAVYGPKPYLRHDYYRSQYQPRQAKVYRTNYYSQPSRSYKSYSAHGGGNSRGHSSHHSHGRHH